MENGKGGRSPWLKTKKKTVILRRKQGKLLIQTGNEILQKVI